MENHQSNRNDHQTPGLKGYIAKRLTVAILVIILVVWAFASAPNAPSSDGDRAKDDAHTEILPPATALSHTPGQVTAHAEPTPQKDSPQTVVAPPLMNPPEVVTHQDPPPQPPIPSKPAPEHAIEKSEEITILEDKHTVTPTGGHAEKSSLPAAHEAKPDSEDKLHQEEDNDRTDPHDAPSPSTHEDLPTGVAFVDATIKTIDHELNKRFWGWRPNDIVNVTDNVSNFQLGALEVTRRTVVMLAERISRTGTTDAFNPHLENAMNWLMVKASRYWFPSPESKYKESIDELMAYKKELLGGRGSFYTRTDNLIPLLSSYEDLLGSCDENLVKQKNEDGSDVSLFKADDYFFYAKGVASTMATLLESIHHDFHKTLESRNATELLHHALESCRQAAALDPLLITNGDLDGTLANHRANMAAPVSHARFYIGQLIKTLST